MEPGSDTNGDAGMHRKRSLNKRALRVIGWCSIGAGVLAIACYCALLALLDSNAGHRYVLRIAQRKASAELGVPVSIENIQLNLAALNADLYGLRIAGAVPHSNPPLLQANHLKVGVRITSLLRRSWYLSEVQIDHPVVWVLVDKNGASNIPVFKSSGSSHTSVFDLGIRHAVITQGEVYYNSRPQAITADLHNVAFRSVFSSLQERYSGRLAYRDGNLAFGALRPLQHNLDADFDATPEKFTLKRATVTAGPSSVILSAALENYSDPSVSAQYQIVLDGRQAAQILNQPAAPVGMVRTSGSLRYRKLPNRTAIQSLLISGTLQSAKLAFATSTARTTVTDLSASYALANGDASLKNLRAGALGGELLANGTTKALGGNVHSQLHVNLHEVSLAALQRALGTSQAAKTIHLTGNANATATATWGKTIGDLMAQADLTLSGDLAKPSNGITATSENSPGSNRASGPEVIPIEGSFHAQYSNANRSLSLNNSFLKSSNLNLLLNGTVGRRSSLTVNLHASDLGEIGAIAGIFGSSGASTALSTLKGKASFHGTVTGSTSAPQLAGQLSADDARFKGTSWKSLKAEISLSPSSASLQDLRLQAMDHGLIQGSANVGLHDWKFTQNNSVQTNLTASDVPTATIAALAGRPLPVTGTLDATAHLHGTAMMPSGNASLRLIKAQAFGEPLSLARVDLSGSGTSVKASATVRSPAGTIEARVTTDPNVRTYSLQLTSSGVDLSKIQAITSRGIEAKGLVEIRAEGQGTYDDPGLQAQLKIPSLEIGGQTISQTALQVNDSHHVATVDLSSLVAGAQVQGKARITLQGNYMIDASLDTPAISLQPFLAAYAPGEAANLTGQTELHATIHGPLKDETQLQAHLKLPLLKIDYGNAIQLAASPIQADYTGGMIRLQPTTIHGTDTNLSIQGAFPAGGNAPATLQAHGSIDLKIAQLADPDLHTSGKLVLNINSTGSVGSLLAGEIDVAGVSVSTTTSPVSLQQTNGVLKLTNDRLTISSLNGKLGDGSITAQGAIIYRPNLRFDLGVSVNDAQLLYPQGLRETVNAKLRLTGVEKHATLGGAVDLSSLSFTPAFDLSSVLNQFSGGVEVPQAPGFQQNLQLNVAVNASNNVNLVSRTLSVSGSANLQIRGTAAQPVVLGRVNLNGGDVILNGTRFVLTGGTVQFVNPAMTEPVLNIALSTTVKQYNIDLRFRGPADQMRTQYTSNPSLPQADIINLLAFGQTTEASAMNATPMNQEAEGLVASQVGNQVTSRIAKAAGISQLSISPVLAGGTAEGPPGANLTIQQRVTGNLFVTFSTNVATTQGQTIQGEYRVSPRVTVSATRDPNGGFALDTLIKKSW